MLGGSAHICVCSRNPHHPRRAVPLGLRLGRPPQPLQVTYCVNTSHHLRVAWGGFHVLMLCRGSARVCAPSCGNATSSQNFTYDPKTKHYTTMARAPVKLYPAGDLLPNPTHMRVYMWGGPCTNDVRWGLHVCIYILYICSARSWNPSAGGPRRDIQGVRLSLGEHAVDGVPIVHCRRRPTHVYDQSVLRCP